MIIFARSQSMVSYASPKVWHAMPPSLREIKTVPLQETLKRIGVTKIIDLGGKPQITCNDVIRNFRKRNFL